MLHAWLDLGIAALEVQQVVWLRMLRMAKGGKLAEREAQRMIFEKIEAAAEAGAMIAAGATAGMVTAAYRKKVRANRKRLSD